MKDTQIEQASLFEHRFWLQVLGDHARFIFTALSPVEHKDIQDARQFIHLFDNLLAQARAVTSATELRELNECAFEYAKSFRCFKLQLLGRHLTGKLVISLSPTFINHMLNELEEYLCLLEYLTAKTAPPLFHPIHHHLLWLADAHGHAATLAGSVDLTETALKQTGEEFAGKFRSLYLKAIELKGYLRTGEEEFPALGRYNCQVEGEILRFNEFLCHLLNLAACNQALGTVKPLLADHMLREEYYFLTKLAQVADISLPDCDPTKPRLED